MQTHPKNTPKPTFNSYQKNTKLTAIYPSAGQQNLQALTYLALGLAGESGEAVEKIKKIIRSAQPFESQKELIEGLHKELGDVLWYLTRMADELGTTLEDIAAQNLEKLKNRQKNQTLHGHGDTR